LEEEIKEKQNKLTQNIKIYEEEAEQARRRADKYVLIHSGKSKKAKISLSRKSLRNCSR
jgi:hypothetical protein